MPKSEPERTCIVTREAMPRERLIRFVAAPDGTVVADLRGRLPGRGAWVTASADKVRIAEKKRLFGRALDAEVTVAPGLAGRVAENLASAALGALSLARKAGAVVSGFAKVDAAVRSGKAIALIHAAEAGEDGVEKLERAARGKSAHGLPVIRLFTGEQLDLAFGRANVIHAALLAGPAGINVLKQAGALADYLGDEAHAALRNGRFPAQGLSKSALGP
jgi:uncharacterized protein